MDTEQQATVAEQMARMPAELAGALIDAQGNVKAVEKDSQNSFHKYKYASAEAIIGEARSALNKAGLAVLPLGWRYVEDPNAVDGGPIGRMLVTYRLLHRSGRFLDFESSTPVIPEKGRPEDKAEATALTYNLGYTLRGLLLIPRGDEETNVDNRNDTNYQPRARGQAPMRGYAPQGQSQHAHAITPNELYERARSATTIGVCEEVLRASQSLPRVRAMAYQRSLELVHALDAVDAIHAHVLQDNLPAEWKDKLIGIAEQRRASLAQPGDASGGGAGQAA